MLSALGEPPVSGNNSPACADGAASRAPASGGGEREQQATAEYDLRARARQYMEDEAPSRRGRRAQRAVTDH